MIMVDARVARDAQGQPLASPEIVIVVDMLPKRSDGDRASTSPSAASRRWPSRSAEREDRRGPHLHARALRADRRQEGRRALQGLEVGGTRSSCSARLEGRRRLHADGSGFESEIWGDVDVMAPAFNRTGGYQSLTRAADRPVRARGVQRGSEARTRTCSCRSASERAVLRGPGGPARQRPDRRWPASSAVVMGIGAVFGAMNTMYAHRRRRARARSARCARSASRASRS